MRPTLLAFALALLAWLLVISKELRQRRPEWHWYLTGYPRTALRVVFTWSKVAYLNGLTVSRKPTRRVLGDLAVKGDPLRPVPPGSRSPAPPRTVWNSWCAYGPGRPPPRSWQRPMPSHTPGGCTPYASSRQNVASY